MSLVEMNNVNDHIATLQHDFNRLKEAVGKLSNLKSGNLKLTTSGNDIYIHVNEPGWDKFVDSLESILEFREEHLNLINEQLVRLKKTVDARINEEKE